MSSITQHISCFYHSIIVYCPVTDTPSWEVSVCVLTTHFGWRGTTHFFLSGLEALGGLAWCFHNETTQCNHSSWNLPAHGWSAVSSWCQLVLISHSLYNLSFLGRVELYTHCVRFPTDGQYRLWAAVMWEVWHEDGDKDYMMFWESVVPDWVWLSLFPYLTQGEWYEVFILRSLLSSLLGSAHSQLFPHWSTVSDDRTECCHVTQIVNILRNLSFEDSNSQYLAHQEHLIRYMYTVPSAYYHRIWAIVPLSCFMYGLSCCSLYYCRAVFSQTELTTKSKLY